MTDGALLLVGFGIGLLLIFGWFIARVNYELPTPQLYKQGSEFKTPQPWLKGQMVKRHRQVSGGVSHQRRVFAPRNPARGKA